MIVDNPKKGLVENNIVAHMGDSPCKHLRGDKPGEYLCEVHNYPWYKETPCFSHTQIEKGDTNCRMGEYILYGKHFIRKNS